ncbi:hypothetical protein, partial [Acinetobacter baumannii]|uniref:hypothetical protein n=1 Tax=Acinetobacter baumannii TaxID=470 RepID=UPI001DFF82EE
ITFNGSIEVLNLLLGEGNDRLTITGTRTVTAVHGGITTVHGGGNSLLGTGQIGGDTITVTGGGGPDSPLVVYGDTSQDGRWYAGEASRQSVGDFGPKPFPNQIGNPPRFVFPLATAYHFAGNDVIDASAALNG